MKKLTLLLIPLVSLLICFNLVFTNLDNKISDLFQRSLPPLKESPSIVMVNIDDSSVNEIGTWPFSREVYSKALVVLKDLGAEAAVFDLSFLDKSQSKVNKEYVLEDLPHYVDSDFDELLEQTSWLMDSNDGSDELEPVMTAVRDRIKTAIQYAITDADKSLATDLKFFNNSYLTLTFADECPPLSEEEEEYLKNSVALKNIRVAPDAQVPSFTGVQPAIPEFLMSGKSAGFVNAEPDTDGYLRHVYLVYEYNGSYYGQLLFVPILQYLGNPEIEVRKKSIVLHNCSIAKKGVRDITIPLANDGSVIVKYPPKSYYDYNSLTLWSLYRISRLEDSLIRAMKTLNESGFFSFWEDDPPYEHYFSAHNYIHDELASGKNPDIYYNDYYTFIKAFYNSTKEFLYGSSEQNLIDSLDEGDEETASYIRESMASTREIYEELVSSRTRVENMVRGSFCIFGTSATSTTDFGLIQYEERYPNPGVHYTIANQLLSMDFVREAPVFVSVLLAFILCFSYTYISIVLITSTGRQLIFGITILVISTLALLLFYRFTRIYTGTAVPIVSLTVNFIAMTIVNLISTSKDKKFITGAFSQCLSRDVVQNLISNPDSFKLGGDVYEAAAIFTDIQKFSSFSELLNAEQIVALLNFYLTRMSDIIMEEKGTIDKYEGDAIIAIVGAPLIMTDYADHACAAAIKMKAAEQEMNLYIQQVVASETIPAGMDKVLYDSFCIMVKNKRTLFTRIGINSGEIVAGYMGSENKKNYTMMGNNVNLASRLEGVNKQYHTGGILISEATREKLSDRFLVRGLDRVQVVNVKTPIRLFEVIGFKSECDDFLLAYMDEWDRAMKLFEKESYDESLAAFKALAGKRPEDNVAAYYVELLERFFTKGCYPTEADDFGVAFNAENPADMNPQWAGTKYEIKGTFRLLQK